VQAFCTSVLHCAVVPRDSTAFLLSYPVNRQTVRQTAVKTYSTFCHQRVQLNNALCKLHNKILVYRQCPACYSGHARSGNVFTARHNARIASAVLAIAIPSVSPSVCLSHAARRYCAKTTARRVPVCTFR